MDPIPPPTWWENPTLLSAGAACISAFFAGLTTYLTTKKSTREMIDIVKADILVLTAGVESRELWQEIFVTSQQLEGGGIAAQTDRLAEFLAAKRKNRKGEKKYLRAKWQWIIPAAIEELRNEGYKWL